MTDRTVKTHLWIIGALFLAVGSLFFAQSDASLWSYGALVFTTAYLSLFSLMPLVFFFSELTSSQNRALSFFLFMSSGFLKVLFLGVLFWLVLVRFEEFAFSMLLFIIAAATLFISVFVFDHVST